MTASPGSFPKLLDTEQVADRLGTSIRHVRRLVDERRIPYVKVGWLLRFDADEIARWLDQHRTPGR
jgi:excisionase family DNA binding protein